MYIWLVTDLYLHRGVLFQILQIFIQIIQFENSVTLGLSNVWLAVVENAVAWTVYVVQ
jgi:hypothetical protein